MSDYKMNQDDLQSYFKSLCNSFYIAYEQVKRLEKEEEDVSESYNEEDLKTVKKLLEITDSITTPNNYFTLKFPREELLEIKERLEKEQQEYQTKIQELEKICKTWSTHMWYVSEAIKNVLYTIKDNGFLIIVTTKAEIYALIGFYYSHKVKNYPIINMDEETIKSFPCVEELSDDFIFAYKEALDENGKENIMAILYNQYF